MYSTMTACLPTAAEGLLRMSVLDAAYRFTMHPAASGAGPIVMLLSVTLKAPGGSALFAVRTKPTLVDDEVIETAENASEGSCDRIVGAEAGAAKKPVGKNKVTVLAGVDKSAV
jgi:hypothetical protein